MTVLLIWSLADIEAPLLITSENQVIDLLTSDPIAWQQHISRKNQQRVLNQLNRWKVAIQAGANAIDAYGYAVSGHGYDFPEWLLHEGDTQPLYDAGSQIIEGDK